MDVSDVFYFSARGNGKGEAGGEVRICTENAKGGGVLPRGGDGEGSGSVCREGGGANIIVFFFSGPKCPPRIDLRNGCISVAQQKESGVRFPYVMLSQTESNPSLGPTLWSKYICITLHK